LNGDLYEAGGGIESGYYRLPVDVSSLMINEMALKGLNKSVQALENMLLKRNTDTAIIDQELLELHEEQVRRSGVVKSIEENLAIVKTNLDRTNTNIQMLNKRIRRLSKVLDRGKRIQLDLQSKKSTSLKDLRKLRSQKKKLERTMDSSTRTEYETEQVQSNLEINELNKRLLKIESEINLLNTSLKTTLKPERKRIKLDLKTLTRQVEQTNENLIKANHNLDYAKNQLSELEKTKTSLSDALTSVKVKRKEFETRLDTIETQLQAVTQEYEPLSNSVHQLDLNLQRKTLECKNLQEELLQLGYEKPILVNIKELKNTESSLNLMNFELEQLGSINQLAPQQYSEQQKNYKELSVRRNQLESERKTILEFIGEVERQKTNAFMETYNKVNKSFSFFFGELTDGGKGFLSLEKPEDPFLGGLDIFVQFPGKALRLISGASGGEKSVVAVAFIFAIQSLSPASFYVLDEIDAHLDPYYAERLADLLKKQARNSQFIIVTLRDVLIDRAEKLFGLYVQNGISKLISTKMVEVMPQIV
jgi:chromosome segregation protein